MLRDLDILAAQAGIVADVHERRQAAEDLAKSERRLALAVETADLVIWDLDLALEQTWWSEGKKRVLGLADDAAVGDETFWRLVHPDDRKWLAALRDEAFEPAHGGKFDAEFRIIRPDTGEERWVALFAQVLKDTERGPYRVLGTLQDMTHHRQHQELLFDLAYYDQLTKLPNRLLLAERTEAVIQSGYEAAVLIANLRGFKPFNDSAGEKAGDELLKIVAGRLTDAAGQGAVVARMGGDEFAILLPKTGSTDALARLAGKIQAAFSEPIRAANRAAFVGVSMGAAVAPAHGASADELIAHADLALGESKTEGTNLCRFFTADLHQALQAAQALEAELRRARSLGEFDLYYQPQVRLADRKVIGVEALLRWAHPTRGVLSPAAFLAVLERSAAAQSTGDWVIRTACTRAAELAALGFPIRMAVNLFPVQINVNLFAVVGHALQTTGLAPALFEIELTENLILDGNKSILTVLESLRELGVGVAFDDYGTGYASLSMLKHLPVTRLKIDRTFVQNLGRDRGDVAIVEAILSLGHNFKLAVTAEGIESAAAEQLLLARGCEEGQGFLYREPCPFHELVTWLRQTPTG
jgi:diguanylate cyclase (GGDEF)-like protein/PAS domain S-box-containing protein